MSHQESNATVNFILRLLGVMALLAVYVCAYFPFAMGAEQSGLMRGRIIGPVVVLNLMLAALVTCKLRCKPHTAPGRIAFWLCAISLAGTIVGLFFLFLPQQGHPSIGIFYLLTPIGLNAIAIPMTLLCLALSIFWKEKWVIVLGGFLFMLAASFVFSSVRFQIPPALDAITGTHIFSKIARRLDREPGEQFRPNYDEMTNDIVLIKKGPLDTHKLYHLETAAGRAPQFRCAIIDEVVDEFPTVQDFETQRRVLAELDRQRVAVGTNQHCARDLVLFHHKVMLKRNGDVGDMAAWYLMQRDLDRVLSDERYAVVARDLAEYALERQRNPQRYNEAARSKYFSRTFDGVAQINSAASNLVQKAELGVVDRRATTNLSLFVPYLEARIRDQGEANHNRMERNCSAAISWITQLQEKKNHSAL